MFKRLLISVFVIATTAGCAVGSMTPPVNRELRASASQYDANFAATVRTLNALGAVTSSDKSLGYVNGMTSLNVKVTVQLEKNGAVNTNAQLPGDKFLVGTTLENEAEKVRAALQSALR